MKDLAELFKALADETRLAILGLLLLEGELCVCDVEGVLGITQSKSSRHLRYLRSAGLVGDRREGVWVHYAVPADLDRDRRAVLEAARVALGEARLTELRAAVADWRRAKAAGASCKVVVDAPLLPLAGESHS